MSKCSPSHFGMHEQHMWSMAPTAPFGHLSVLHRLPPPHPLHRPCSHHIQLLCRSWCITRFRGAGALGLCPASALRRWHIGFRLPVGFVAMRLLLSIFEPEPPSTATRAGHSSGNSESPSLLSALLRLLFARASFAASSCLELECRGRPRAAAFSARPCDFVARQELRCSLLQLGLEMLRRGPRPLL